MLTIYLANNFINEAYDFVKPYMKQARALSNLSQPTKEVILHFFIEAERFKLIKKLCRLSLSDQDLLHTLIGYFEVKQDLTSIALAINLHIDSRNYSRAIELHAKYAKQLANSDFDYLASLIDVIQNETTGQEIIKPTSTPAALFTCNDIRQTVSFQYSFNQPLSDLCTKSKRCLRIWSPELDANLVKLMSLPEIDHLNTESNINMPQGVSSKISYFNKQLSEACTPFLLSKTVLHSSLLKRKCSTPHPEPQQQVGVLKSLLNVPATDSKVRLLTSALRNGSDPLGSVVKSVKFNKRYSRTINENDVFVDDEEVIGEPEAKKLFDGDEEEDKQEHESVIIFTKIFKI